MHEFNNTLLPYLCHLPTLPIVPAIPVFHIFLSVSHLPAVIKLHHVLWCRRSGADLYLAECSIDINSDVLCRCQSQ